MWLLTMLPYHLYGVLVDVETQLRSAVSLARRTLLLPHLHAEEATAPEAELN